MERTVRPRVKICCIGSADEAWLAIRYGATALGLVSSMPSGPGVIADDEIAAIARCIPPGVATFLLTSRQDPAALVAQQRAVKELGGTGRVHNWEISRAIREAVDIPVYLAGGLKAENVAEAIRRVGPFGLDVCSGVRTNGALDEAKLAAFFAVVSGAA